MKTISLLVLLIAADSGLRAQESDPDFENARLTYFAAAYEDHSRQITEDLRGGGLSDAEIDEKTIEAVGVYSNCVIDTLASDTHPFARELLIRLGEARAGEPLFNAWDDPEVMDAFGEYWPMMLENERYCTGLVDQRFGTSIGSR